MKFILNTSTDKERNGEMSTELNEQQAAQHIVKITKEYFDKNPNLEVTDRLISITDMPLSLYDPQFETIVGQKFWNIAYGLAPLSLNPKNEASKAMLKGLFENFFHLELIPEPDEQYGFGTLTPHIGKLLTYNSPF